MDVEKSRTRSGLLVAGIILVVIGCVWTGQGAGLIGGSFMTGQTTWLVIGVIVVVLGLALIAWSRLKPGPPAQ